MLISAATASTLKLHYLRSRAKDLQPYPAADLIDARHGYCAARLGSCLDDAVDKDSPVERESHGSRAGGFSE